GVPLGGRGVPVVLAGGDALVEADDVGGAVAVGIGGGAGPDGVAAKPSASTAMRPNPLTVASTMTRVEALHVRRRAWRTSRRCLAPERCLRCLAAKRCVPMVRWSCACEAGPRSARERGERHRPWCARPGRLLWQLS